MTPLDPDKVVALVEAAREIEGVLEAHDVYSLDCDRSGSVACDCLDTARKKLSLAVLEFESTNIEPRQDAGVIVGVPSGSLVERMRAKTTPVKGGVK